MAPVGAGSTVHQPAGRVQVEVCHPVVHVATRHPRFMIYFMGGTNLFGLALFLPSIVNQLGNSPNKSQLLSVGPFGAAFVCESHYLLLCSSKCSFFPNLVTVLVSYISDRTKNRVVPLCTVALVAMAGYALYLGRSKHPLVCYRCHLLITP